MREPPAAGDRAAGAHYGHIPLIDPGRQHARLGRAIDDRIARVMAHGRFIGGPEVAELESTLAARTGAGHCVAVSSGTDALILALHAAGIGPGDAVLVPAMTYVATAGAAVWAGATPVFVEVDPESFTMDPAELRRCVRALRDTDGPRPRAAIAVDLFGLPADYDALGAVASEEGLTLIADAAQSLGARLGDRPVGSLASVTATSFFPTKPLACCGDGGALFTDDADTAEHCRSLRVHGFAATDKTQATVPGLNARLDTLQAAILLAKLPAFDDERRARARIAARYDAELAQSVALPPRRAGADSAWSVYTIRSPRREALRADLAAAGIATGLYYPTAVHEQPAYSAYAPSAGLPVAEGLCRETLALPLHADLTEEEVERVVAAVNEHVASG